jgi:signal recognition particle subunit SRP54
MNKMMKQMPGLMGGKKRGFGKFGGFGNPFGGGGKFF